MNLYQTGLFIFITDYAILLQDSRLIPCCPKSYPDYRQDGNLPDVVPKVVSITDNMPSCLTLFQEMPIISTRWQLNTKIPPLTGIYSSTLIPACYLQRGSLPDVVPKFTHLIKKMTTHRISCLNSAVLFTRQRLVRCYGRLCLAYRQHRHLFQNTEKFTAETPS